MRTCESCGAALADHMRFCKECGTPAPAEPTAAPAVSPAPPPTALAPPRGRVRRTAPTGRQWWDSRATRAGARTLLAIALAGSAFLVGWFVASDRSIVPVSDIPERRDVRSAAESTALAMPDLRGLQLRDARQILTDLGVGQREITVESRPAAGEANAILGQDPVYGYDIEGQVTLTVAQPARVPSFAGRRATAVLAELEQLGASVRTVSRYVPGVGAGEVASMDPAPGQRLPQEVTVVIATAPETVNLAEIYAVEDGCWADEGTMNGQRFNLLLSCDTYAGEPLLHSYVINRAGARLTGVVGVPDSAETDDVLRVEIRGDGRSLATYDVGYGRTAPIDLDVSGVLRLTFRVTTADQDGASAGLGRLLLEGDPSRLAKLEEQ